MFVAAHFDGNHILLDEPVSLKPDTKIRVEILDDGQSFEEERREWSEFSLASFARLYDDEPDVYTSDMIKIKNPKLHGGK